LEEYSITYGWNSGSTSRHVFTTGLYELIKSKFWIYTAVLYILENGGNLILIGILIYTILGKTHIEVLMTRTVHIRGITPNHCHKTADQQSYVPGHYFI